VRLFIAVDLSQSLRENLAHQIDQLRGILGEKDIRWVKASGIHLTLKFLGETPEDRIETICHILGEITPKFPSFQIQVKEFGCFPNMRRPRVLWVGIHEETDVLVGLHREIETAFQKLGYKREGRPFRGHLTLGRIRKRVRSRDLVNLADQLRDIHIDELGTQVVNELCLFRSILRPSGAEYTRLGTFSLRNIK
jgi:2'-5' RNA ligase